MTRWPRVFSVSLLIATGVAAISKILRYDIAPSAVTPAKYCSMSSTFTSFLATAITRRAGWEIVQWTGIGDAASAAAIGGHGRIAAAALRAERRQANRPV